MNDTMVGSDVMRLAETASRLMTGPVRLTMLQVLALSKLYQTGYAVAQELRSLVEAMCFYAPGHQRVKRAFLIDLPEMGLATKGTPQFIGPSRLALVRLTQAGLEVGERLSLGKPAESEWGRVIERHPGEEWERHTVGLLAFAWQARRRGYQVRLLPEAQISGVTPDALIWREGEQPVYVEFEVRARGRVARWRRWDEAQGLAAVCTFAVSARQGIMREFDVAQVSGWGTDLQTLIKTDEGGLLWPERQTWI